MKFFSIAPRFFSPSLDLLGSRKPAHEGIKEWYPRKNRYFTVVGQFFMKTVADGLRACCLSQQALVTRFSVISTSKDPELPK